MKSNKEFLEGVYKKAEEIKKDNYAHKRNKHYSINFKTAVAALAVIALIPFTINTLEAMNGFSRDNISQGYAVNEMAEEKGKSQVKEADMSSTIYYELNNMISSSSIIVTGEIISLGENTIDIEISDTIKGNANKEVITLAKIQGEDFLISEEVLLFLREGDNSSYTLTENTKSFFKLYTIIDNNKIFKSLEGLEITLEELNNLIHGG